MLFCRNILVVLLCVLAILKVEAKHIVGGDMTYTCVGIDTVNNRVTFRITMTMYRDCFQGGEVLTVYDEPAVIGIHAGSGNSWRFLQELGIPIMESEVPIIPDENPCVTYPPNLCVDRGTYVFTISLAIIEESYLISYQRCCRNNSINNILQPGNTGAVYSIEISPTAQQSCNNSPIFNDFPPILICNDFEFIFDHSARDPEGDQLVYEFCAPLAAGGPDSENPRDCTGTTPDPASCRPPYQEVRYVLPTYSPTAPVIGEPALTLGASSGIIVGRPNLVGQYVVGVCVKEFRDGVLIGTVRRDFQFNVTQCDPNVFAQIKSDAVVGQKEYVLNSCGVNTITFENESFSQEFISSYLWKFVIDDELQTSTERDATFTFPGIGEYEGLMILNEGLECADTASIYLNVYPSIDADFSFEYDTCVAGEVFFQDLTTTGADFLTDWHWDFAGDGEARTALANHLFSTPGIKPVTLTVADNNECVDEITKMVDWRPVPPLIIIEPSVFIGCRPGSISFINLSSPIDSTYSIDWDFGDGQFSDLVSPSHIYEEAGIFSVGIEITSPIGCKTSRYYPNWIIVEDKPIADFSFSPEKPNNFRKEVQFTDHSYNAVSWQWNFNNQANSFVANPNYTFQDTGLHFVQLIVLHPSGCTDTMTQLIDIEPIVDFFMPNAFTPNGDGKNDYFKGKGFIDGLQAFSMTIWDQWGQKIFETSDPTEGWNGQMNNYGDVLPNDVYVYLVTFDGPRGEKKEVKGYATLIR